MRSVKEYGPIALAILLCPCHWPLLALVLSGTAIGAFASENLVWLIPTASVVIVSAFVVGSRLILRDAPGPACATCQPASDGEPKAVGAGFHGGRLRWAARRLPPLHDPTNLGWTRA